MPPDPQLRFISQLMQNADFFFFLANALACLVNIPPQKRLHSKLACCFDLFLYYQVYPNQINSFHATGLFLQPLKNIRKGFLMFSGGIERDQGHEMS